MLNKEAPIFETGLTFFDNLEASVQIIVGLCIGIFFLSEISKTDWGGPLFISVFFIILSIQVIRSTKTFHLFRDHLAIRRPFLFTNKTDVKFKIEELKEVIFRNVKRRFGGPHIIIKSKKYNESYRIDFKKETLGEFIMKLNELGVLTSKDNM